MTHTQQPKVYITSHQASRVVSSAFAQGCNGQIVPARKLLDGSAVVYGILRGTGDIIKECSIVGREFFHIDHGYFCRQPKTGIYAGYYRITRNALQVTTPPDQPPDRFERLDVRLRPWRRTGSYVLVCPSSQIWGNYVGVDSKVWTDAVVREIALHTDRPIIIKQKDEIPLKDALNEAWCVVVHSSNAAVDSVAAGIPAIVTGPSAVLPVCWGWGNIEQPYWPDREQWAWNLAYNQFNLNEMRDGTAWRLLNGSR
jgi:hypothetical protein